MQTFLPYPSFIESAKVLDYRRLGKQRVEAYQILRVLTSGSKGWANHPAVKMWTGYEAALLEYGQAICGVWKGRGFKDTIFDKLEGMRSHETVIRSLLKKPRWLGEESFHASHRSNLLRKDPAYYGQFRWAESDMLPYVWPIGE